jgi:nucleotide-binding universal stress UspA family protein
MFNHIVAPLDGSRLAECVLPHLMAVARACGSRITLLRVLERADASQGIDLVDWHIRKAETEAYLRGVAAEWQDAGVTMERAVLEGDAEGRILEFARDNGADLIVLSSHGRSGLTGWNVSGVVQKIILHNHASTMIVRAYQPVPGGTTDLRYRRIMVPLDGSQRAECVLPFVSSVCRLHESVLLVPHVVRRPEMPRRAPPSQIDLELAERITERNCEEGKKYLEQIQGRLSGNSETRLLVSDTVTVSLHELATEEQVDLVVMCAHGYSGETRWPYGSTVISFIAYGTSPLLIVQDLPQSAVAPAGSESRRETQAPPATRRLIPE